MTKLKRPKITDLTESSAKIDMGDREIIVTKLLPISGNTGFTACEKLYQHRVFHKGEKKQLDQMSKFPVFPRVLKDCNNQLIAPSIQWAFDYVTSKYEGYKNQAQDVL